MQMCAWAVVSMSQFWLNGRTTFLLTRVLLGLLQGGFIPDLILYLSYFYTKYELPFRLALFWFSADFCNIIASFLAVGLLRMRGVLGKAGWQWLFLIEGLLTLLIGIAAFFQMPPSPTQTKTWFRPKGWFTERQEYIATSRILRDDPSKGDMHNREALTLKSMWKVLTDFDLCPLYIIGLLCGIPSSPPETYITLSLRNLGFNIIDSNLLIIPFTVGGMATMLAITIISEKLNDRSFVSMTGDVWTLPLLIALRTLPDHPSPWLFYALSSVLLMYPFTHPIQAGWLSRNSGGVATRTVSASLYNMYVPILSSTFVGLAFCNYIYAGSCRHPPSSLQTFIVQMMRHYIVGATPT
jgi:sugar phosphate permease